MTRLQEIIEGKELVVKDLFWYHNLFAILFGELIATNLELGGLEVDVYKLFNTLYFVPVVTDFTEEEIEFQKEMEKELDKLNKKFMKALKKTEKNPPKGQGGTKKA